MKKKYESPTAYLKAIEGKSPEEHHPFLSGRADWIANHNANPETGRLRGASELRDKERVVKLVPLKTI